MGRLIEKKKELTADAALVCLMVGLVALSRCRRRLWAGGPANGSAKERRQQQTTQPNKSMNERKEIKLNLISLIEWFDLLKGSL